VLFQGKVEKLVKPPQKPVVNNKVWFEESKLFLKESPDDNQSSKHPYKIYNKCSEKEIVKSVMKI